MDNLVTIIIAIAAGIIGSAIAWLMSRRLGANCLDKATVEARRIVDEAEKVAAIKKKEAILEAREKSFKVKSEFDREMQDKRQVIEKSEREINERNDAVKKKVDLLQNKERDLGGREKTIHAREKGIELRETELKETIDTQNEKLQKIAQMSPEDAKKQLMDNMMGEARLEAAAYIKEIKDA